jgi:hypothetical protein
MATIVLNTDNSPRLSSDGSVLLPVLLVVFLVWVVVRSCHSRSWDARARGEIRAFDSECDDLVELIDVGRVADGFVAGVEVPGCYRTRFRPVRMQRMACALANSAYLQFGYRPKSEANVLITRKFMRDELSKFKDLRVRDSLVVIDRALTLSFLPSEMYKEMQCVSDTRVFRSRESFDSWWRRWLPFGGQRPAPI